MFGRQKSKLFPEVQQPKASLGLMEMMKQSDQEQKHTRMPASNYLLLEYFLPKHSWYHLDNVSGREEKAEDSPA